MRKTQKPPVPPKKLSPTEKMIQDCVKNARARKRSGETDQTWREQYAASLKVDVQTAPLSKTPFEGDTTKKKS